MMNVVVASLRKYEFTRKSVETRKSTNQRDEHRTSNVEF
ncbi:MAG: hypothetical protein SRB1_02801 [Desulfobacteraceae bacterium Eth-SRB1]|nr:MAG: hypothetical protein SRB1_02801 [Desulfobacteraceae bacterium Eth-SRB1]